MISRYQCKIFSVKDGKSGSLHLRNLFQRASLIIFLVIRQSISANTLTHKLLQLLKMISVYASRLYAVLAAQRCSHADNLSHHSCCTHDTCSTQSHMRNAYVSSGHKQVVNIS